MENDVKLVEESRHSETSEKNEFVWKQTYLDENGKPKTNFVNMFDMTPEHIQKAFYHCQLKINEHFKLEQFWANILVKLEHVAETKNIELKDANDKIIKSYHYARRKNSKS